jgi:hypothetical protein
MSFGSLTILVHKCEEREDVKPATSRKARKCGVCVEVGRAGSSDGGGVAMKE